MIIFNNGKTLEFATPVRSRENVYGASRPIMEISVNSADTTEEEIRELFYDADALSKITVTDFSETGEEVAYEYANYKLPIHICSYESDGAKTITMKIGQLTATELQQEQLIKDNEDITNALVELAYLVTAEDTTTDEETVEETQEVTEENTEEVD